MGDSNASADSRIIVKTYKGSEAAAGDRFKTDATAMAAERYVPEIAKLGTGPVGAGGEAWLLFLPRC